MCMRARAQGGGPLYGAGAEGRRRAGGRGRYVIGGAGEERRASSCLLCAGLAHLAAGMRGSCRIGRERAGSGSLKDASGRAQLPWLSFKLRGPGAGWRTCNGAADARPSSFHPRALSFLSPRLLSSAAAVRRREQRSLQLARVSQPRAAAAARPRPASAAPLCGPPPARPAPRVAASCPRPACERK